jgi:hypothetical protein
MTANGTPSVRDVLFEPASGSDVSSTLGSGSPGEAVDKQLTGVPPGLRGFTRDEILRILADVLQLPIMDLLAAGWRKWDELIAAARRTLANPGESDVVELANRQITSSQHPRIEVELDGEKIATIDFEIEVTIEVHAVTAIVTSGKLSALRSGQADIEVTLAIANEEVAKKTRRFELPLEISLGTGILLTRPQTL